MNLIVFDLETQNLFEDVGGRDPGRLRVACAVTWSTVRNGFAVYWEKDVPALVDELKSADLVVGFNIKGFDYQVLKPYAPNANLGYLPTLDLMDSLYRLLGFRVKLDAVAKATLGTEKTADGVQSVNWFRAGELDKVAEYCKADVDITRRVFEFGRENGFVYYLSRLGSKQRVLVNWKVSNAKDIH
jgi:DEAD/DEAH box helicase domain-containing protein